MPSPLHARKLSRFPFSNQTHTQTKGRTIEGHLLLLLLFLILKKGKLEKSMIIILSWRNYSNTYPIEGFEGEEKAFLANHHQREEEELIYKVVFFFFFI
jgi:hypothetical protein